MGIARSQLQLVKRIQRGDVALNAGFASRNSTLPNAVVMANTEVRFLGVESGSANLRLLDTTHVQATRQGISGDAAVQYEVTEWIRVSGG